MAGVGRGRLLDRSLGGATCPKRSRSPALTISTSPWCAGGSARGQYLAAVAGHAVDTNLVHRRRHASLPIRTRWSQTHASGVEALRRGMIKDDGQNDVVLE
jgi:hypothetical protein